MCGDGNCDWPEDGSTCPQDCCDANTPCAQTKQNQNVLYCRQINGGGYQWYTEAQGIALCDEPSEICVATFACGGQSGTCKTIPGGWVFGPCQRAPVPRFPGRCSEAMLRPVWRALALGFAFGLLGCSSSELRGGDLARSAPEDPPVASWIATDCKDASGAPFRHVARVTLHEDESRVPYLVEAVPSYDGVVVRQRYENGAETVYQVFAKAEESQRVLRDYRVPKNGKGDGRMGVGTSYWELPQPDGTTRGRLAKAAFACRLALEKSSSEGVAP